MRPGLTLLANTVGLPGLVLQIDEADPMISPCIAGDPRYVVSNRTALTMPTLPTDTWLLVRTGAVTMFTRIIALIRVVLTIPVTTGPWTLVCMNLVLLTLRCGVIILILTI